MESGGSEQVLDSHLPAHDAAVLEQTTGIAACWGVRFFETSQAWKFSVELLFAALELERAQGLPG